MPTWFWFKPTSMAICRLGTPSEARSTMRARCATRRDTCSPCALRSSSRLSSLVIRNAGTIRIALPQPFQFPSYPSPRLCDERRPEGVDQRFFVLLQPTEVSCLVVDHLDQLVDDSLRSTLLEAGRQPEDPDQPLHPEDDRQRLDLAG